MPTWPSCSASSRSRSSGACSTSPAARDATGGRLARCGYDVTGIDNDPAVRPDVVADLRELDALRDDFDAVINMWASFGYFSPAENERVLAGLAARLRPGGRLILDLFNGALFRAGASTRELRPGVVERSTVGGGRRRCELDYGDGHVDVFEWQLYEPDELAALGAAAGLATVAFVASGERPLMQLVFERL